MLTKFPLAALLVFILLLIRSWLCFCFPSSFLPTASIVDHNPLHSVRMRLGLTLFFKTSLFFCNFAQSVNPPGRFCFLFHPLLPNRQVLQGFFVPPPCHSSGSFCLFSWQVFVSQNIASSLKFSVSLFIIQVRDYSLYLLLRPLP